jgi:hypothetical protein
MYIQFCQLDTDLNNIIHVINSKNNNYQLG